MVLNGHVSNSFFVLSTGAFFFIPKKRIKEKEFHLRMTLQLSSNAPSPILQLFGTSTWFIFVFENTYSPILNNNDGNSTLVNELQSVKHLFPIDITPSGIMIVEIFVL